ncbi:MAG: helix-turn-helix domain-containing protein [Bacillus subtilis]|nr:helix-turn-helix domain-containing protein [Bacillus subtilis]
MSSIDCGRFIAQLRKDKRITQTELADLLQVTNKAISRWETGEGYPDVSMLPKLAEVLEVSIDELLKGERKDSLQRKNRRPYVKFVNAGFSSIVLIIASLFLFLAITYSTYKVWLGVIGYLIPSVVAILWFFNQRNELFETCDYTDSDKQLLTKWTRRVVRTLWIVTWMIVPQIAIVAQSGNWGNATAVFTFYAMYAAMAGIFAVATANLVLGIIERRFHFNQLKNPDIYVAFIALTLAFMGRLSVMIGSYAGTGIFTGLMLSFSPALLYAIVTIIRLIRKKTRKPSF